MKTLLLAALLCCGYQLTAQILNGQAPLSGTDEYLMACRLRALRLSSPSPQQEQFLGIPDLGVATWRTGADAVFTATNQFTFRYDAVTDSIYTTLVSGPNTYQLRYGRMSINLPLAGKTRNPAQMNVWQMSIRNQQNTSATTVSNIAVNGVAVHGSFTNNGNNTILNWYAFNTAFAASFTFTCTITLSGTYGGGTENNRVEFSWGSSFAVLPGYFNQPALAQQQGQWHIQWQTDAGLPVQYFELERSANGRDFSSFTRVAPRAGGNYHIPVLHQLPYQYYRIAALLPGGTKKYSPVMQATERAGGAPLHWWLQGGQLWVRPLTGTPVMVRVSDVAGRLLYAGLVTGTQALPLGPASGMAWLTMQTPAGMLTQPIMPR